MSLWILLVVVAQFLYAIVALIDRYIVTNQSVVPRPLVYAFYISVLSAGSMLLYLFSWIPIPIAGLEIPRLGAIEPPTLLIAALSLLAGYSFFQALVSMFTALQTADASDVAPVVGATSALATFFLGYLVLGTALSHNFVIGFLLLVFGTYIMVHFRFNWRTAMMAIHSGILFAVHYVAIKGLFEVTTFDNGFFWSRMGIVAVALSMLLVPRYFEKITAQTKKTGRKGGLFVLGNKVIAGFASILVLKAIELGDVSIVQALGALQYVFLIAFALVLGHRLHRDCGEDCRERELLKKSTGVSVIAIGFFMLFL